MDKRKEIFYYPIHFLIPNDNIQSIDSIFFQDYNAHAIFFMTALNIDFAMFYYSINQI